MSEQAQLRRGARSGRRLVAGALPPGPLRWIEFVDREWHCGGHAFALAGALGAIGLGLGGAFQRSGSEVRDLIWALHRLLDAPDTPQTRPVPAIRDYEPWLRAHLRGESQNADQLRRILFRFIDVVSERLTLRGYHRAELRGAHARALIGSPLEYLSAIGAAPRSRAEDVDRLCEIVLWFWDHLGAQALAALGGNRIAEPDPGGFGGFFSVSGHVQPPSEEEIRRSLGDLDERARALDVDDRQTDLSRLSQVVVADIHSAIGARLGGGQWPEDFRPVSSEPSEASPHWWRRMRGSFS